MESIDDLLAEVKAEYLEKAQPLEIKKQQPSNTKEFFTQPPLSLPEQTFVCSKDVVASHQENLLAQIRAEFEEQEREEQLKREQQKKEEQLRQQQIRQQQRDALRSKAEDWLKNLTLLSEEGLWFEEFAYKYPSKLEAAIDYLQALPETES